MMERVTECANSLFLSPLHLTRQAVKYLDLALKLMVCWRNTSQGIGEMLQAAGALILEVVNIPTEELNLCTQRILRWCVA